MGDFERTFGAGADAAQIIDGYANENEHKTRKPLLVKGNSHKCKTYEEAKQELQSKLKNKGITGAKIIRCLSCGNGHQVVYDYSYDDIPDIMKD